MPWISAQYVQLEDYASMTANGLFPFFNYHLAHLITRSGKSCASIILPLSLILLPPNSASADTLTFSFQVTVSQRFDHFVGDVVRFEPVTFVLNGAVELGSTYSSHSISTEAEWTRAWINLDLLDLSESPFTSNLLQLANGAELTQRNDSFARQEFTDYFDPEHYDYSSKYVSITIASYSSDQDPDPNASKHFRYYRGLIITLPNSINGLSDVQFFDNDSLREFIMDAEAGLPGYGLYYSEAGLWQTIAGNQVQWSNGYTYSSVDIKGFVPVPEPSTSTLTLVGILVLTLRKMFARKLSIEKECRKRCLEGDKR